MSTRNFLVSLVALVTLGAGCSGSAQVGETHPADQQAAAPVQAPASLLAAAPVVHSKLQFSLTPPLNWTSSEEDQIHDMVLKADHADSASAEYNYRANITVDSGKFTDNDVIATAHTYQEGLRQGWKSVKVVNEHTFTMNNEKAAWFEVQLDNTSFAPNGMCEVVRAEATAGYIVCGFVQKEHWDEYKPAIEQSLASFKP